MVGEGDAAGNVSGVVAGEGSAGQRRWGKVGRASVPSVFAPWVVYWSEEHARYWFHDPERDVSVWELPQDPSLDSVGPHVAANAEGKVRVRLKSWP